MKTSKLIMAFALIAVIGTLLAVRYSSGQRSSPNPSVQQPTLPPSQAGNSAVTGPTESPVTPPEDITWFPNHRLQTVRNNRLDVVYLDSKHGWKMVEGQGAMNSELVDIYQTTDGGKNWIKIAVANQRNISAAESTNLPSGTLPYEGIKNGLSFVNSSTGWITGYVPRAGYQWIFVTYNGGKTWVHQELPVPKDVSHYTSMSFDLTPPTFFSSEDGILIEKIADVQLSKVYPAYVFFYTQDAGRTWQEQSSSKFDLKFPDSDPHRSGPSFSVTVNDKTWHTSDSGYTWES